MLLSKYSVCNSKISKFFKEQEPRGLLSSLGIRTPLSPVFLVRFFCFKVKNEWNNTQTFIRGR